MGRMTKKSGALSNYCEFSESWVRRVGLKKGWTLNTVEERVEEDVRREREREKGNEGRKTEAKNKGRMWRSRWRKKKKATDSQLIHSAVTPETDADDVNQVRLTVRNRSAEQHVSHWVNTHRPVNRAISSSDIQVTHTHLGPGHTWQANKRSDWLLS